MQCLRDGVRRLWRLMLALPLLALTAPAFTAQQRAPAGAEQMRFVVVRSNAPGCEPTCPEWIWAQGEIGAKTPALLKGVLKTLGGRKLPLVVSSTGGDAEAAMALGRTIRKNRLSVAVARTSLVGCQPGQKDCTANDGKGARYIGSASAEGAFCISTCPLMLAGGVRRLAGEGAAVGLIDAGAMSKAAQRRLRAYLDEMGVDQAILNPSDGASQQVLWSMFKTHLLTSTLTVDLIIAGDICKGVPAPDNCRVFTVLDLVQ